MVAVQGMEDVELVEIGALLHDVHDWKYSGSETASADAAHELLSSHVCKVCWCDGMTLTKRRTS